MSFQLPRSSLINIADARNKARTSTLQFSINPDNLNKNFTVNGILKNKPKYSIEANYDRLINMDDSFAFLNKVGGAVGGIQVGLTKEWTQQVFKGGSYLTIALQARIIQDEFISNVVATTTNLISLCNPRTLFSADSKSKFYIQDRLKKLQEENGKRSDEKTFEGALINAGSLIAGLAGNIANSSPPLCWLKISNYFSMGGFFVKSVAFEFSHEQTENGPLYSDIDVELVQSQIVRASEIISAFNHIPSSVGAK